MSCVQTLYLTRRRRVKSLYPNSTADFLSNYSDAQLIDRIEANRQKVSKAQDGRAALILGARSNYIYQSLNRYFNTVDQLPIDEVNATVSVNKPAALSDKDLVLCPHLIDWFDPNTLLPKVIEGIVPGGELYFSFYGEHTAASINALIGAVAHKAHFQPFYALSDVGDHIAGLGLSNVVIDSERLNLEYASVEKLLGDARMIDGSNFNSNRNMSLTPKGTYKRVVQVLEKALSDNGVINAEIELCYARGMKRDLSSVKVGVPTIIN